MPAFAVRVTAGRGKMSEGTRSVMADNWKQLKLVMTGYGVGWYLEAAYHVDGWINAEEYMNTFSVGFGDGRGGKVKASDAWITGVVLGAHR